MISTNLKVGLFVLVALALIVVGVLVLGVGAYFRTTIQAETYVNESVQGLDLGSPVKYRGVKIGTISHIGFVSDAYPLSPQDPQFITYTKLLLIRLDLDPIRIGQTAVGQNNTSVDVLVEKGLRVRMASQGLTGTAYLDIDFLDPGQFPPIPIDWQPDRLYIPSAPSVMASLSTGAEGIVRKLDQIDAPGLAQQASALLEELRTTNRQLQVYTGDDALKLDLKATVHEAAGALTAIRALAESSQQELTPAAAAVRAAAERINHLAATLDDSLGREQLARLVGRLDAASAELARTTSQLPAVVGNVNQTLAHLDALLVNGQRTLGPALDNLSVMSRNLRSFSETAARYPSQILFGGPPAPASAGAPRR